MRTCFLALLLVATAAFGGVETCQAVAPQHSKRAAHAPKGWQPGGPLRPIYQEAVRDVHAHQFDAAEVLCHRGLALAPGDAAFTDLLGQIPQWRVDDLQSRVTATYKDALTLVQQGHLDAGAQRCQEGLKLEPGNRSFQELLQDIAQRRNVRLQAALLKCYNDSSLLLARGQLSDAEVRCRQGLQLQPSDVVLNSLLAKILKREGSGN